MPLVQNPPDQTLVLKGLKSYTENYKLNEFLDDVGCETIFPSKAIKDGKGDRKRAFLNYGSPGAAKAALAKLLSSKVKARLPGFIDNANFACVLKSEKPASKPSSRTSNESHESEDECSDSDESDSFMSRKQQEDDTFVAFLVKKLQSTPGGTINAAQVPGLATKRKWKEELDAACGVKGLCIDNVGKLKWIHTGGSGEVGLDTQKSGVNVGDAVKVTSSQPAFGRGDIHAWSIGKVISIQGPICTIDFPEQSGWRGHVADVRKASEDEQRALSVVPADSKFGRCFFVRNKDAGVFEFTGNATDNMRMFERQYGLIRGSAELNREQGGGYFEIEILRDNPGGIAVGLCGEKYNAGAQVGWFFGSIGYHSDDGNLFFQQGQGRSFGPTCGVGDRMGCGALVGSLSTTVYFTKNGTVIGRFMVDVKSDEENQFPLLPTVTSSSPAAVKVILDAKAPQGASEPACVLSTKMIQAKYNDDSKTWKNVTKQGPMRDNGEVPVTFEKFKDIVWVKPRNIRIAQGKDAIVERQSFASLELALALAEAGDTIEVYDRGIHMMSKHVVIRKDLTIRGIPSAPGPSGRPTISCSGGHVLDVRSNLTLREMHIKSVDGDRSARINEGGATALFLMAGTLDLASCTIESEEGTGLYVEGFAGSSGKALVSECDIGPCGRHGVIINQTGSEFRKVRIADIGMIGFATNPGAGCSISESEISRSKQKGMYLLTPTEPLLIKSTTISDCPIGVDLERQTERGGLFMRGREGEYSDKSCAVKFERCRISQCREGISAAGRDTHVYWDKSSTFHACSKTTIISLGAELHDEPVDGRASDPRLSQASTRSAASVESSPSSPTVETEEQNFWRFFRLVSNVGTQVLLCTFKEKYKQATGQVWTASLGPELCKALPRKSLEKLGKQACEFIKSGESDKWDITVLSSLLLFEPGYLKNGSPEFKACMQIRGHRNELNHAKCFAFKCDNCQGTCKCGLGQPIMSHDDFSKLWASVSATIQSLVETALPKQDGNAFLNTIQTIRSQTVRVKETNDLRDRLFSEMKETSEKLQILEENMVTKSFFHKTIESLSAMIFKNGKIDKNKLPTSITLNNNKSYTLVKQAGHGGMGTVFEALDHESKERVALKLCDGGDEDRAEREVQNMRKLTEISSTENVVQFIDSALHHSHYVIIMEFIQGKSLSKILFDRSLPTQNGHMSWQETLPIMMQVAAGMAQVHKLKIAHRDLKPANIMMTDVSQRIVIVDFGLSKQHGSNQTLTKGGGPGGTTIYMSPEQTDDECKKPDAQLQTDVWAMGIIWYEMLSGVTPFEPLKCEDDAEWASSSADARSGLKIDMSSLSAKNFSKIVSAIDGKPVPWERLPKEIPKEILQIIERCLQKNKEDRHQDAQELLDNITDVSVQLEAPQGGDQPEAKASAVKPFKDWSVDEVAALLAQCGFHEAACVVKEDGVDGQTWLEIEQEDEKEQEEMFEHLKMNKLKRKRFKKERDPPSK